MIDRLHAGEAAPLSAGQVNLVYAGSRGGPHRLAQGALAMREPQAQARRGDGGEGDRQQWRKDLENIAADADLAGGQGRNRLDEQGDYQYRCRHC